MTLDPEYLRYPKRTRGMDHDYYPWSNLFERDHVTWPNRRSGQNSLPGKSQANVAIWPVVSLEYFPIHPRDEPFRAPGHMQTAYPDYRHYTAREYGTRIGVFRLLDAFEANGVSASFAVNSEIAVRYPELVAAVVEGGHEIIAHSTDMNGTIASGMEEGREAKLISESLDKLERVCGSRPKGWLSIARSQSFDTARLLKESGVQYMCDWVNDEMPYYFSTSSGPIINLPLNHELSDRQIINVQQNSAASYCEQMRDAFNWLDAEASNFGGRLLPMHISPYIMGLPYRIDAFEGLLAWLSQQPSAWFARSDEIVKAWAGQAK